MSEKQAPEAIPLPKNLSEIDSGQGSSSEDSKPLEKIRADGVQKTSVPTFVLFEEQNSDLKQAYDIFHAKRIGVLDMEELEGGACAHDFALKKEEVKLKEETPQAFALFENEDKGKAMLEDLKFVAAEPGKEMTKDELREVFDTDDLSEEQNSDLNQAYDIFHAKLIGVLVMEELEGGACAHDFALKKEEVKLEEETPQAFVLFENEDKGKVMLEDLKFVAAELGKEMTKDELREVFDADDLSEEQNSDLNQAYDIFHAKRIGVLDMVELEGGACAHDFALKKEEVKLEEETPQAFVLFEYVDKGKAMLEDLKRVAAELGKEMTKDEVFDADDLSEEQNSDLNQAYDIFHAKRIGVLDMVELEGCACVHDFALKKEEVKCLMPSVKVMRKGLPPFRDIVQMKSTNMLEKEMLEEETPQAYVLCEYVDKGKAMFEDLKRVAAELGKEMTKDEVFDADDLSEEQNSDLNQAYDIFHAKRIGVLDMVELEGCACVHDFALKKEEVKCLMPSVKVMRKGLPPFRDIVQMKSTNMLEKEMLEEETPQAYVLCEYVDKGKAMFEDLKRVAAELGKEMTKDEVFDADDLSEEQNSDLNQAYDIFHAKRIGVLDMVELEGCACVHDFALKKEEVKCLMPSVKVMRKGLPPFRDIVQMKSTNMLEKGMLEEETPQAYVLCEYVDKGKAMFEDLKRVAAELGKEMTKDEVFDADDLSEEQNSDLNQAYDIFHAKRIGVLDMVELEGCACVHDFALKKEEVKCLMPSVKVMRKGLPPFRDIVQMKSTNMLEKEMLEEETPQAYVLCEYVDKGKAMFEDLKRVAAELGKEMTKDEVFDADDLSEEQNSDLNQAYDIFHAKRIGVLDMEELEGGACAHDFALKKKEVKLEEETPQAFVLFEYVDKGKAMFEDPKRVAAELGKEMTKDEVFDADDLSEEQNSDLNQAYDIFHAKRIGVLDMVELEGCACVHDFALKKEEVKCLMPSVKEMRKGLPPFRDIVQMKSTNMLVKEMLEEETPQAFVLFENEDKGKAMFEDLKRVADELGKEMTKDEVFDADDLSEEQNSDLNQAYDIFHVKRIGVLDMVELEGCACVHDFALKKEEVKCLMPSVKVMRKGLPPFRDIVQMKSTNMLEKEMLEEETPQAFVLFENEDKGKAMFEDLKRVADELGKEMTKDELREVFDADDLSEEQNSDLNQAYDIFHAKLIGVLDMAELEGGACVHDFALKKEEVKCLMPSVKVMRKGLPPFRDIVQMKSTNMLEKEMLEEETPQAFVLFENEDKGKAMFEDLKRVADELGKEMTKDELREVFDADDLSEEQNSDLNQAYDIFHAKLIGVLDMAELEGGACAYDFALKKEEVKLEEETPQAFVLFEYEDKGKAMFEDLKRVAAELGKEMTKDEVFDADELDKDGEVSEEDLVRLLENVSLH